MALDLPRRIVEIHHTLDAASLSHAFGGALALAWCTERARATIDIDVNVFLPADRGADALAGLPDGVAHSETDLHSLERDGQVRVWWDGTPIDLFLNTTEYHEHVGERIRWEPFMGEMVPFLACSDLAVFKAFVDRTKDWADLEAMVDAGSLDVTTVLGTLTLYLGGHDHRVARLRTLALG
jgi:hypothetical protein